MRKFLLIFISMFLVLGASLANDGKLVITCTYDENNDHDCTWDKQTHQLTPIRDCKKLNGDPLYNGKILYLDAWAFENCKKIMAMLSNLSAKI